MPRIGGHAVVIGASMGGLLAARALVDYFESLLEKCAGALSADAPARSYETAGD